MSEPGACDDCLRRAWLIGGLSGAIERALAGRPSTRTRELLALSDAELSAAVTRRDEVTVEHARGRDPDRLRDAVAGAHCWACCRHDPAYPEVIGDLTDPPAVLFGRGDPALLARLQSREGAVTIVGSRRGSGYGRELAEALAADLAGAGLVVVSGMAIGIDSAAHRGALDADGLTVAVLGSGADVPSPRRMAPLYERIEATGLILSELPPGSTARRWTFPARNRIMAALGAAVVVVEARHGSGSLITADIAKDLGRDVGAAPGLVGSSPAAGTNQLIREGAQLIRDAQDVLDALLGPGVGAGSGTERDRRRLDPELAEALDAVETGAGTQDEVARECDLDAGAVAVALTRLELLGLLACDAAGRYRRTQLAPDRAA